MIGYNLDIGGGVILLTFIEYIDIMWNYFTGSHLDIVEIKTYFGDTMDINP